MFPNGNMLREAIETPARRATQMRRAPGGLASEAS